MERELLLLGLLRQNEMYGYQINEMIDSHFGGSINLTKPTTYRTLHNMAKENLIKFREEKQGNRPTRRVYAITVEGEKEFHIKLKESLRQYIPSENQNAISLAFLDAIPIKDAISRLEKRQSAIEDLLQPILENRMRHADFQLLAENQILHLSTELEWLKEVIKDLSDQEIPN